MKIHFAAPGVPKTGALITGVMADGKLTAATADLDRQTGGAITRAIKSSRLTGKKGQILEILAPHGLENGRILLVGMGDAGKLDDKDLADLAGAAVAHLQASGEKEAAILTSDIKGAKKSADRAAHYAFGATLRAYRFDKYRTKEPAEKKPSLKLLTIHVGDPAAAKKAFQPLQALASGIYRTRDLVSEPGNVVNPKSFAAEAKSLSKLGLQVKVLGEAEMRKLGFGALLGVAQGSANEPQVVIMEWMGAGKSGGAPLAIVGKGVTFDSGGISLKPGQGMEDMKWDMGGAGTVIGLMEALARRKAKVNVVGFCGLVENMPDGKAQRPGDVVRSYSGQTIEVINTDAEGRLVLADVVWYAQERYKPKLLIDLATLTGAIIVALGHINAGLYANDDKLADALIAAGKATGEGLWRMPLGEEYDRIIDSDIADMRNSTGRDGGSVTAAQFIGRFIKQGTTWAHLDIAGMAWSNKAKPTAAKGATAFGVRLLERFIADNYEK